MLSENIVGDVRKGGSVALMKAVRKTNWSCSREQAAPLERLQNKEHISAIKVKTEWDN